MSELDLMALTVERRQGLLSQLIVPRPIAMVTTTNVDGSTNVAPYSYFMPMMGDPPRIALTIGSARVIDGQPKHTWTNIERTGEFVVNQTTSALAEHIEATAREYPAEVSELGVAGWTTTASKVVSPPRLVESPAQLECRVSQVVHVPRASDGTVGCHLVIADVVWVRVDDRLESQPGRIDPMQVDAVGRMGFPWFIVGAGQDMFQQARVPYTDR